MSKILVAVYGSLRKGFHNHVVLGDSKYLGEFKTLPEYSLYNLGSYPGLKENGKTSVITEVYEITKDVSLDLDWLEGYKEGVVDNSFYDKKIIQTTFGDAYLYIYIPKVNENNLIESGDWKNN